jgi:heme oxygenase
MTDPLAGLRAQTQSLHRQLESAPIFSRLQQPDVGVADVVRAFHVFHAFYDGLEPVLLPRLVDSPWAGLYRPRRGVLARDLANLGAPLPPAMPIDLPVADAALLGIVYAVEGSALGGRWLQRHLAERLGGDFAHRLSYFSAMADGIETHWPQVLSSLRRVLADAEQAAAATDGAMRVFNALLHLAAKHGPPASPACS